MKKHNTYSMLLIVLIGIFSFVTSCEGPEGPVGPVGAQGPAGANGTQGPPGPTGNANVIASDWITNVWTVAANGQRRHDNISAPEITQAILDKGGIFIYWRRDPETTTAKLIPSPIYNGTTGAIIYIIDGLFQVGFISVYTAPPPAATCAWLGIEP